MIYQFMNRSLNVEVGLVLLGVLGRKNTTQIGRGNQCLLSSGLNQNGGFCFIGRPLRSILEKLTFVGDVVL